MRTGKTFLKISLQHNRIQGEVKRAKMPETVLNRNPGPRKTMPRHRKIPRHPLRGEKIREDLNPKSQMTAQKFQDWKFLMKPFPGYLPGSLPALHAGFPIL